MRRASTAESCGGGGEGEAGGLESEEKRVGERRSEQRERVRERTGRGEGGGVQLIRVDGRCVRFRASLLLLIRTVEGGRFGELFKAEEQNML